MEFRQLQYFLLVAQELSFSKASQKAFVTQQALSKSILSLEEELGVSLFERLPHGIVLTPFGQSLLKNAYHISDAMNEAINDIHNMKANLSGTIQLAITIGVENDFPVQDLFKFQEIHPQYQISTITSSDMEIEDWLLSGKIELGLMGALGSVPKLDYILLKQSSTLLAVHKNNPLSKKDSVQIEDLRNEHFLFGQSKYYANSRLVATCNLSGFTPEIKHQTGDIDYLSQLITNNQGIFLCPDTSAKFFNHPDIVLIPFKDDPYIFCVYLAIKKTRKLSPEAELFKDFLLHIKSKS